MPRTELLVNYITGILTDEAVINAMPPCIARRRRLVFSFIHPQATKPGRKPQPLTMMTRTLYLVDNIYKKPLLRRKK